MQEKNYTIKKGLFYHKNCLLTINSEFIKFEFKKVFNSSIIEIDKNSISEYRFGIKWITGFEFVVGRFYHIHIKDKNNKIIKINLKSFYGIKKNEFHELYVQIIETLWKFYFLSITEDFFNKFNRGEEFNICGVNFSEKGLTIKIAGLIKDENVLIPWEKVGTSNFQTYFAIFSLDNASKLNSTYIYSDDWNVGVLYSIVRALLSDKENKLKERDTSNIDLA